MPVDLGKVFLVLQDRGQRAYVVDDVGAASAGVPAGEECPDLNVVQPHVDVAALIAIADASGNALGEVVLQLESVDLIVLAEEVVDARLNYVGTRAGGVLRARRCSEGRRATGRIVSVGSTKQRGAEQIVFREQPRSGNAEVRKAETVDDSEFVGDMNRGGIVRGGVDSAGMSRASLLDCASGCA